MIYLLAVVLGLIQALTEFLPISSSAHLILARAWLDFDIADGLTFDVALHVGTLVAIVFYFRNDIAQLIRGFFGSVFRRDADDPWQRLSWYIAAACVPAAIVGLLFESAIELYFRNPGVIVVTLVAGGVLFIVVERVTRRHRSITDMTLRRAVMVGVLQTLALIPGVSRSGITIATGMALGFHREEAARFSFLLSAPLLAGAGAKKGLDLVGQPVAEAEIGVMIAGLVVSALAGWLVIRFLLSFLRRHGLYVFAYYRFALAVAVLVFMLLSR